MNNAGNAVSADWFKSVDTTILPTRNVDGTINMNGVFELTDKAPAEVKTFGIGNGTASEASVIPASITEDGIQAAKKPGSNVPATPAPTETPDPTKAPEATEAPAPTKAPDQDDTAVTTEPAKVPVVPIVIVVIAALAGGGFAFLKKKKK